MKWEDFRKGEDVTISPSYAITNIECPQCGKYIYEDMTIEYLTIPTQYNFYCFNCGWSGRK